MASFFKKKVMDSGRVGVTANAEQMVLAHVVDKSGVPYLSNCERIALHSENEAGAALEKLVKNLGLENLQCSFVLSPRDYSLHLLEAPEVEPDELKAAVRWKIKDLLDMKVEEAAIDVFQVPEDAYRGRTNMVYVVAALKSRIESIVEMITNSGLELAVIDIPELAMKNLSSSFIPDENGVAFMDLRRTGSTMNLSKDGDLYLTRRINTQLGPDVMRSEQWDSLKDRLVLEIQRSLDYYESHMGQGQITQIVITQRQEDTASMIEILDAALTAKVTAFDLSDHIDSEVNLTPEMQQVCLVAIAATLRRGKKARLAKEEKAAA